MLRLNTTKMNGVQQTFYEDGKKKQEYTLVNGVKEGVYKTWYRNGQLDSIANYTNGILEGPAKVYYNTGVRFQEYNYVKGKIDGLFHTWNEYGEKSQEYTYVKGKQEGLYKEWYSNGNKKIECTFNKKRSLNGFYLKWDNVGNLITIKFYINANEISLKDLKSELTKHIKEELVEKLFHPDRVIRIANTYNMNLMEYLDIF